MIYLFFICELPEEVVRITDPQSDGFNSNYSEEKWTKNMSLLAKQLQTGEWKGQFGG